MEFRCRLGTDDGEVLDGTYTAENEAKLRRDLESRGLCILSIRRRGWSGLPAVDLPRRRRVAAREFIVFNQELAALLGAGIPLVESLDIVRRRADNALFQGVLDDVYERVRSGAALSAAFEAQGDLFPGVYTASVLAGEKSGGLEEVLRRYIAYARVIGSVRRRTLSALAYPGILLLLSVLVVAIIVLEVVPQFADFYAGMNAELPLATRVLMGVSVALREFWVLVAAAGGGVAVAVLAPARVAGSAPAPRPHASAHAAGRCPREQVRRLAARPHPGDAAGGRDPAGVGARHRRTVDRQPPRGRPVGERVPRGSRGAGPGRLDGGEGSISPGGRAHGGGR